jgi:hypothetical protein
MIKRGGSGRNGAQFARPVVAIVAVLLLLLQGAGASVASVAHMKLSSDAGIAVAAPGADCTADGQADGPAPAHKFNHGHGCLFCGARDVISTALPPAASAAASVGFHAILILANPPGADALTMPLIGWASSWSSQAPPSNS